MQPTSDRPANWGTGEERTARDHRQAAAPGDMPIYLVQMARHSSVSTRPTALDIVGGTALVGEDGSAGMDLVRLVRQGLPVSAVQSVLEGGWLTPAELDRIVLPRRTLANRRRLGTVGACRAGACRGRRDIR